MAGVTGISKVTALITAILLTRQEGLPNEEVQEVVDSLNIGRQAVRCHHTGGVGDHIADAPELLPGPPCAFNNTKACKAHDITWCNCVAHFCCCCTRHNCLFA